jgi:hypothetical protein
VGEEKGKPEASEKGKPEASKAPRLTEASKAAG